MREAARCRTASLSRACAHHTYITKVVVPNGSGWFWMVPIFAGARKKGRSPKSAALIERSLGVGPRRVLVPLVPPDASIRHRRAEKEVTLDVRDGVGSVFAPAGRAVAHSRVGCHSRAPLANEKGPASLTGPRSVFLTQLKRAVTPGHRRSFFIAHFVKKLPRGVVRYEPSPAIAALDDLSQLSLLECHHEGVMNCQYPVLELVVVLHHRHMHANLIELIV